jgi:hypothetical protein
MCDRKHLEKLPIEITDYLRTNEAIFPGAIDKLNVGKAVVLEYLPSDERHRVEVAMNFGILDSIEIGPFLRTYVFVAPSANKFFKRVLSARLHPVNLTDVRDYGVCLP